LRESPSAVLAIAMLILGICAVCWTTEPAYGQATGTIVGIIHCGSSTGCGSIGYGAPIDVAGSVRAHRTDGSGVDVNATFTAADHGAFRLEVPGGSYTYEVYGAAVGYQTALLGSVTVFPGKTLPTSFSLMPCPSSGCVPIPEFGPPIITTFIALVALTTTILMMRKTHH